MPQPARHRRAFTLTELAIVLGVIGLILGAIWTAAAKVYANNRVNKGVQQVLAVSNGVRSIYNKGYVDAGVLSQLAVNNGLYPPDMLNAAGCNTAAIASDGQNATPCPLNPWNGELTLAGGGSWCNYNCSTNNHFQFVEWNMGSNCPAFMAAIVAQGSTAGLIGVYSDTQGWNPVSTSTSLNSGFITSCAGNVVLEFNL